MEFGISDEQKLLQESISRFCKEQIPLQLVFEFRDNIKKAPSQAKDTQAKLWKNLASLGICGILIPEKYGGSDLNLFEATLIAESLGYCVAPVPYHANAILAPLALLHTEHRDKAQLLSELASGNLFVGIGLTEKTSVREDSGIVVRNGLASGKALLVMDSAQQNAIILTSVDAELLWLDSDAKGINKRFMSTIDNTRHFSEISLDATPVEVLASGSTGKALIQQLVSVARVLTATDTLGAAQLMIDMAVAYSLERRQFNRLIGSFQAVKHLCAEMTAKLEPCRALVWYAAHSHQVKYSDFELMACHAKALLSDVGKFVARTSVEVHGGMGFTDQLGLHFWFKRIGMNRQFLGGPVQVRATAAKLQGYCD